MLQLRQGPTCRIVKGHFSKQAGRQATAPSILARSCSSCLQHAYPPHPTTLPTAAVHGSQLLQHGDVEPLCAILCVILLQTAASFQLPLFSPAASFQLPSFCACSVVSAATASNSLRSPGPSAAPAAFFQLPHSLRQRRLSCQRTVAEQPLTWADAAIAARLATTLTPNAAWFVPDRAATGHGLERRERRQAAGNFLSA